MTYPPNSNDVSGAIQAVSCQIKEDPDCYQFELNGAEFVKMGYHFSTISGDKRPTLIIDLSKLKISSIDRVGNKSDSVSLSQLAPFSTMNITHWKLYQIPNGSELSQKIFISVGDESSPDSPPYCELNREGKCSNGQDKDSIIAKTQKAKVSVKFDEQLDTQTFANLPILLCHMNIFTIIKLLSFRLSP
ncbi:hypothetical protein OZX74_06775 [Bifidobacterium sp. ESL0798]|uniref:hypothetical protein n=1 Tax=Bifidobacterium sp. ESL0798 TaxID=2983235 RepID=UPI0023F6E3F4|nr:hypothetical protein [Bifidobacterium sp. ESL0798]WEV73615.1 hypothetical protein OZX74_06775 [Bifidobacterium sp. ESL0798]